MSATRARRVVCQDQYRNPNKQATEVSFVMPGWIQVNDKGSLTTSVYSSGCREWQLWREDRGDIEGFLPFTL